MDSQTRAVLGWALYLAGMGWPVFPLKPGEKQPHGWHRQVNCRRTGRCTDGHQTPETYASTEADLIRRAWVAPFNIGVATGPAGLVGIDCDIAKHGDPHPDGTTALATLAQRRGGPLPDTFTVTTPSGGIHRYYRCPPGVRLSSNQNHICPKVDHRAWGGYLVGPGSATVEGGYELADDRDPAELPAWLVQAILERPARPGTGTAPGQVARAGRPGAYGATALTGECDRIRAAVDGHNQVLCSASYRIGQLVGARVLDHATAHEQLLTAAGVMLAAARPGCQCTPAEVERVITAGLDAGSRNPRRITTKEVA